MMKIIKILNENGIKDFKDFKVISNSTREFVIEYETNEDIFFLKAYQNNDEKNILGYIINTGLTEVITKNNHCFIERKIKYKKIDELYDNVGSLLARGYNKLHENMIVYNDCIDEHWFYDKELDIIKFTDFGSAKLKKETDDDIYMACFYLKFKFDKNKFGENWKSFKEVYNLKEDLKKFEDKYMHLIINYS